MNGVIMKADGWNAGSDKIVESFGNIDPLIVASKT